MERGKFLRLALIIIAIVAATAVLVSMTSLSPGVIIYFTLYESDKGGVVQRDLFSRGDVIAAVFVRAITPDGEERVVYTSPHKRRRPHTG